MEDKQIVDLFWERSETAISETASKYGNYCHAVAYNILGDGSDAMECVNDTYLSAWNSIPPHRPAVLSTYLGKLTRRISIDKWRKLHTEKRGGGQLEIALEELKDCIPDKHDVERQVEFQVLQNTINTFIKNLPQPEQKVFLRRYWYFDPISSIAEKFGFSQSKVKSMLFRTREKLKKTLSEEELL